MKELDPGHKYQLDSIDGVLEQVLTFVKREGPGYPGNVGHYPGTLIQHVLRALILRLQYLDNQIEHPSNQENIRDLRVVLLKLEERAAGRHKLSFDLFYVAGVHSFDPAAPYEPIEDIPYCGICGHMVCHHGFHKQEFFKITLSKTSPTLHTHQEVVRSE